MQGCNWLHSPPYIHCTAYLGTLTHVPDGDNATDYTLHLVPAEVKRRKTQTSTRALISRKVCSQMDFLPDSVDS
jgi:hypothetical protein